MRDAIDELTVQLRQLAPVAVRVYAPDGTCRDVGVPQGRKRWSHVTKIVDSRPWQRAELLDAKNRVLGEVVVAVDDDQGDDHQESTAPIIPREERLLDLMIKAQNAATKDTSQAIGALGSVVQMLADAQRQLHETYMATMRALQEQAAAPPAAPAAPEKEADGMMQIIAAAPQIVQLMQIGRSLGLIGGGPAPAPPPVVASPVVGGGDGV